jgi:hypothetical protein
VFYLLTDNFKLIYQKNSEYCISKGKKVVTIGRIILKLVGAIGWLVVVRGSVIWRHVVTIGMIIWELVSIIFRLYGEIGLSMIAPFLSLLSEEGFEGRCEELCSVLGDEVSSFIRTF